MKHDAETPPAESDSGFILISALILGLITAGLLIGLQTMTRATSSIAVHAREAADSKLALESGLARMLAAFEQSDDPLRSRLVADSRPVEWDFADRRIVLRAQAESGKWDLNSGDAEQINKLIQAIASREEGADGILARFQDARRAGRKLGSIQSVLAPHQRMLEISDRLGRYLTVATNQKGIDPDTAPTELLASLADLPSSSARLEIAERLNDGFFNHFFVAERPIYSFEVELVNGQTLGAMRALVSFPERRSPQIHEWRRVSTRQTSRDGRPPP